VTPDGLLVISLLFWKAICSWAVDTNIAYLTAVGFDKLLGLDEHTAGAAAGVVNAAFVGSEHFDEDADDAGGRVELAAVFAFGAGELG